MKCNPQIATTKKIMRLTICLGFYFSFYTFATGQSLDKTTNAKWYSETISNGILIQNNFPRGGPYPSFTGKNSNYSFLIFSTRVTNQTTSPVELKIHFPADSFPTGEAGNVYMKIFLAPDTMKFDKETRYIAGLKSFLDFNQSTMLQRTINPKEEYIFYIGTVFYQAKGTEWGDRSRGGNRAELILKGKELFYRMPPQIDYLSCGHIISKK
jgi:hypothetical protein